MAATHMEAALEDHRRLQKELVSVRQDRDAALEREAILKGRIEALDRQLEDTKARCDHNLRWAVEVTKQLHNVGMFVNEALAIARQEVAKQGNGARTAEALAAVEKAVTEVHQ